MNPEFKRIMVGLKIPKKGLRINPKKALTNLKVIHPIIQSYYLLLHRENLPIVEVKMEDIPIEHRPYWNKEELPYLAEYCQVYLINTKLWQSNTGEIYNTFKVVGLKPCVDIFLQLARYIHANVEYLPKAKLTYYQRRNKYQRKLQRQNKRYKLVDARQIASDLLDSLRISFHEAIRFMLRNRDFNNCIDRRLQEYLKQQCNLQFICTKANAKDPYDLKWAYGNYLNQIANARRPYIKL